MRIDKFLWCIRVFKTRTLAADNCKAEKVWVNNELIKASRDVKLLDEIKVRKGPIHFAWQVVALPTSRVGAKLVATFATDITSKEEKEKLELLKLRLIHDRPRGTGRPTKKERRQMDDFFIDDDDLFSS
ncbi:MAG: RNA-binding S4 domain-containing protein [Flavobacteriales bacterium]